MIHATPRMPTAARMIDTGTAMPAPLPVNEAPAMVEMKKADAKTGPMKPIDWAITSRSVSRPRPRVSNVGSVAMHSSSLPHFAETKCAKSASSRRSARVLELVPQHPPKARQHIVRIRVAADHLLLEHEVPVDVHVEHAAG